MSTVTYLIKIKRPTRKKHRQWLLAQEKFAACVNECVERFSNGYVYDLVLLIISIHLILNGSKLLSLDRAISDDSHSRAA